MNIFSEASGVTRMSVIISLPSDVLISVFSEYLNLKALGHLDYALTNKADRSRFLTVLQSPGCIFNGEIGGNTKNNDVYRWVNKRNLQVRSAVVRITNATKITEKTILLNQLKFLERLEVVHAQNSVDVTQNVGNLLRFLPSPDKLVHLTLTEYPSEKLDILLYELVDRFHNVTTLMIDAMENGPGKVKLGPEMWFDLTRLELRGLRDHVLIDWLIASEQLETVNLAHCELTPEIFVHLTECPKITSLTVIDPPDPEMEEGEWLDTEAELAQLLSSLPLLTSLTLQLDYDMSNLLKAVSTSCPLLSNLELISRSESTSVASFTQLVALCSNLKTVSLEGEFAMNRLVKCLSVSKSLCSLIFSKSNTWATSITRPDAVNDDALAEVLQHCTTLKHINSGIIQFTGKLLENVATYGIAMESLDLKAHKIQPKDVEGLVDGCPHLHTVQLGGMTKDTKIHWDTSFSTVQAKRPEINFIITYFGWKY